MRNPIRNEDDAFRFVLATIGYFALIVVGSFISRWVGLAVFIALSAAVVWWVLRLREGTRVVSDLDANGDVTEPRS